MVCWELFQGDSPPPHLVFGFHICVNIFSLGAGSLGFVQLVRVLSVRACVLSFAGENISIKAVLSKTQFNKCVVVRQTWSQPQTSRAPTLNSWNNHRAGDAYMAPNHYIITAT